MLAPVEENPILCYSQCDLPSYPQSSLPRPTLISPLTPPSSSCRPTLLRLPSRASSVLWSGATPPLTQGSGPPGEGWAIPESLWCAALCPSVLMVQSPLSKATWELHSGACLTRSGPTETPSTPAAEVRCSFVEPEKMRFSHWRSPGHACCLNLNEGKNNALSNAILHLMCPKLRRPTLSRRIRDAATSSPVPDTCYNG